MLPATSIGPEAEGLDTRAIRLAGELQAISRSPRADRQVEDLEGWLQSDSASEFELGLERMGRMLGFDAVRPHLPAAPDSAWRDSDTHILWEAKSEQDENGGVSARSVRQANTHPTWVERELDWEPDGDAISVVVSSRREIDDAATAVASENVYLASVDLVRELGGKTAELWRGLLGAIHGLSPSEAAGLVAGELATRGLDTPTLTARLSAVPIAP